MGKLIEKTFIDINLTQVFLFIRAEPTKTDRDLFNALGEDAVIDSIKYQLVYKWFNVMKVISVKPCDSSLKKNFKFSTPKLKGHASEAFSS